MTLQHVVWRALVVALLAGWASIAAAIDNPDAPDRVAAFQQRATPFEQALNASDGGASAARAGQAYAAFLDAELNAAYQGLLAQLDAPARAALVASQRRWVAFRDAEQGFIAAQWTRARNGSSASLSAAVYRNSLVQQRVVQLLQYSAEYP